MIQNVQVWWGLESRCFLLHFRNEGVRLSGPRLSRDGAEFLTEWLSLGCLKPITNKKAMQNEISNHLNGFSKPEPPLTRNTLPPNVVHFCILGICNSSRGGGLGQLIATLQDLNLCKPQCYNGGCGVCMVEVLFVSTRVAQDFF